MALLNYHGTSDGEKLDGELAALAWWHRLVAMALLANASLPWVLGIAINSGLDYFRQPAPGRHVHLQMPDDPGSLIGLAAITVPLAGASWASAALIRRRRWRAVSIVVAVLQLGYMPLGTVAAVRTFRLLLFRPDIAAAYRSTGELH